MRAGGLLSVEANMRQSARAFRRLGEAWEDALVSTESANIMKRQFLAMANVLDNWSKKDGEEIYVSKKRLREIYKRLGQLGVRADNLELFKNSLGYSTVHIIARRTRSGCVLTKDMCRTIGEVMGVELMSADGNKCIVAQEYDLYRFIQIPRYQVVVGEAKCPKSGNCENGDSISVADLECARTVLAVLDGMGSGHCAHLESKQTVELMEYFLESGFDEENTIALINGAYANTYGENTVAVDIAVIDKCLGVLNCYKMGAVATYIKRAGLVETVKSTTMPIGILSEVDCDRFVKKLYDGDFVIMISDGVLDNLPYRDKEQALAEIIESVDSNNAGEMADIILNKALEMGGGVAGDDMTVVVAGVFDRQLKV